ncbi:phosphoserine aminotransferase, putative [Eimeria tenella]|uniref:Phosphoserine aminotransferase, putative n=1 Tax=Eimeria tenella TaxID=5802 RepID=U6KNA4_EIMTE|nr:phosphoserine aminotransferase, putative [Eimeria tenella]CDJ39441.1 phosphoserine aminotransferase, putative [Eimeria tenella]|eukprot:XP_013230196.1 phosphoserine aminotransferase, putative [Eimeria tenella]
MSQSKRLLNFSAGPCQLPVEVMEDVQRELVDFRGWGISVMEMSHRGPHFKKVLQEAKEAATRFLEIPQTHNLLFMSGGATAQFAAEALNLLTPEFPRADYAITGYWSKYAMKEASMYGETKAVTDAAAKDYLEIDPVETWEMSEKVAYLHYCENETIHGLEFPAAPPVKKLLPDLLLPGGPPGGPRGPPNEPFLQ